MKYMFNVSLSLSNILNYEGTLDEQIAKLLGWMDQ
jgi:hypothetical protein